MGSVLTSDWTNESRNVLRLVTGHCVSIKHELPDKRRKKTICIHGMVICFGITRSVVSFMCFCLFINIQFPPRIVFEDVGKGDIFTKQQSDIQREEEMV